MGYSLIVQLLEWIGRHSDHDAPRSASHPQAVVFLEYGETVHYEGQSITFGEHLRGVYDSPESKIVLVRPWDPSNQANVSTLLHELVHLVQYHAKEWPCCRETEWEAYKLQEAWLNAQGLEPGFNWIRIYLLSQCPLRDPRDIHP